MTLRERIGRFVEAERTQQAIMVLIILNAITLGMETSPTIMARAGDYLLAFDRFALTVFVIEIGAKLIHRRLDFFRNGWNVFDFVVVGIALMPSAGQLAVLRSLRILRALRLLSVVPQMRKVVQALLTAIPGIGSVFAIIFLIFYVGAVLSTKIFGASFPEWFGTIGRSMFTLFQIMTLESWSMGIVRPVMESFPWAWLFFVVFILVTSFAVVNLFVGIIVDAMQAQHADEPTALSAEAERLHEDAVAAQAATAEMREELAALRGEMAALRAVLVSRNPEAGTGGAGEYTS